jgi:hypothetical protein
VHAVEWLANPLIKQEPTAPRLPSLIPSIRPQRRRTQRQGKLLSRHSECDASTTAIRITSFLRAIHTQRYLHMRNRMLTRRLAASFLQTPPAPLHLQSQHRPVSSQFETHLVVIHRGNVKSRSRIHLRGGRQLKTSVSMLLHSLQRLRVSIQFPPQLIRLFPQLQKYRC